MKTLQLSCALLLIIAISACQKNDSVKTNNSNVSNAEAANMVANSLAVNSNGAVNASLDVTAGAGTYAVVLPCGVTKSDSISRKALQAPPPLIAIKQNIAIQYTATAVISAIVL